MNAAGETGCSVNEARDIDIEGDNYHVDETRETGSRGLTANLPARLALNPTPPDRGQDNVRTRALTNRKLTDIAFDEGDTTPRWFTDDLSDLLEIARVASHKVV